MDAVRSNGSISNIVSTNVSDKIVISYWKYLCAIVKEINKCLWGEIWCIVSPKKCTSCDDE